MDQPLLFSSGLELASLAVSSNLLRRSWDAFSQLRPHVSSDRRAPSSPSVPVKLEQVEHPNCKIIAFVVSPTTTIDLLEELYWFPSSDPEIFDFNFLCSDDVNSFSVNKAVLSLFGSLRDELFPLVSQIVESAKSIPHIITGHCLGGCLASLFTLWLLEVLDAETTIRPICITFGSPLLGDDRFRQAVLQFSAWNSCFLHVVHKEDSFPRLFLRSNSGSSLYKPFATFLWCSETGGACFEALESVMELLETASSEGVGDQQTQGFCYGRTIQSLEARLICMDRDLSTKHPNKPFRAAVVAQVAAIGLAWIQQQQQDTVHNAKIEKIVASEEGIYRIRAAARSDTESKACQMERKKCMANLEWYKKISKSDGFGYYDSYKTKPKMRDYKAVVYKETLKEYWERVVKETEKKPQKEGAWLRKGWLYGGTNYRRMVEPLDIAEYYNQEGNRDYLTQGRSKHYVLLEKWLKDEANRHASADFINSRRKKVEFLLTEDSCFWAHVEEAIISCKLLKNGESGTKEREKLIEFEQYVMNLLKQYAVSPEIFLENSSYMKWWREYEEMMGASHDSQLASFMREGRHHHYAAGSFTFP